MSRLRHLAGDGRCQAAVVVVAVFGLWTVLLLSGATVVTPANPFPHSDICGAAHP